MVKSVFEPPTEHTIWGNRVHSALEKRVRDKTPLSEDVRKWEGTAKIFDTVKGQVFTETRFALTRNLTPCKWNDPSVWCKAIIDLGVDAGEKAALFDWKPGKVKPDSDQLRLSSAMVMQTRPYIQEVRSGFIWLAHDKVTEETFVRKDLPVIWEDFIARSERLKSAYETNKWPPRPSGLCNGWCPVGKANCEYWNPKR